MRWNNVAHRTFGETSPSPGFLFDRTDLGHVPVSIYYFMLRSSNLGAGLAIHYRSRSTAKYRSRFFRNDQKSLSNVARNFPVERREGFGDCEASNCWITAQGVSKDSSR
ncbi:hypothetical protein Y032_0019g3925 [Ancylostoma ceylanicum]|uniref:Uncharacterized protein n=1 Tax=Ancylostoma ceylanicum TaxID=53326 RepID=A0A016V2Z0_9BILA|nr:hypothetical protein Y032_0019g3925 [Ancylostoma ceylanicum]